MDKSMAMRPLPQRLCDIRFTVTVDGALVRRLCKLLNSRASLTSAAVRCLTGTADAPLNGSRATGSDATGFCGRLAKRAIRRKDVLGGIENLDGDDQFDGLRRWRAAGKNPLHE